MQTKINKNISTSVIISYTDIFVLKIAHIARTMRNVSVFLTAEADEGQRYWGCRVDILILNASDTNLTIITL